MKTLGKCDWSDIKVGEVFAEVIIGRWWWIYLKLKRENWHDDSTIIIAHDFDEMAIDCVGDRLSIDATSELHKLRLADQKNWIEWKK